MFSRACSCRQEDTLCAACNSRAPLGCGPKVAESLMLPPQYYLLAYDMQQPTTQPPDLFRSYFN